MTIAAHLGECNAPQWLRACEFARLARAQPQNFDAVNSALQSLAALANDSTLAPPPLQPVTAVPPAGKVSVIICSIHPAKFAAVTENYRALVPPAQLELIGIHDARGLNEAYNRGLDRATGDIVVFSHDDIRILAPDFCTRLWHHMHHFDLLGVAGTTLASGPVFGWSGHPHLHGWVTHPAPDGNGWMAGAYGIAFHPVGGAQMLDGLWFCARAEAASSVRFDESLPGFHFYDVDFTYRCHLAGLRIGICPDLMLVHESHGNFGEAWRQGSAAVLAKHAALRQPAGKFLHAYGARVSDTEGVRRFYAWLAALAHHLESA